MSDLEVQVERAKLAETAERYDDMAKVSFQACERLNVTSWNVLHRA